MKENCDLKIMVENFVFEMIYEQVFNHDEDTKAKSHQIQEKFTVLQNLVNPDLLGIPIEYQIPALFLHCQTELKRINEFKSPLNKLRLIEHIHQNLINAFANDPTPPNADDILPMLITVVLQANPENLHSNLVYIQHYVRKSLLVGEYGYSLMNLIAAVSFLDNLDGMHLIEGRLITLQKSTNQSSS
eukprot:TRINITY_DN3765_c0_g1_i5.p2 TRINITY_DN3765_c0_g1~~TRINITY_DN3765_c0_g1_i5.p2  ORF type:complete len:187 (+),score=38.50 TRINITY_DN3765_c0_g1_i5:984-1544(+)